MPEVNVNVENLNLEARTSQTVTSDTSKQLSPHSSSTFTTPRTPRSQTPTFPPQCLVQTSQASTPSDSLQHPDNPRTTLGRERQSLFHFLTHSTRILICEIVKHGDTQDLLRAASDSGIHSRGLGLRRCCLRVIWFMSRCLCRVRMGMGRDMGRNIIRGEGR